MAAGSLAHDESEPSIENASNNGSAADAEDLTNPLTDKERRAKLVKRMRIQIWAGTAVGFFIALCIGAAFIAVVCLPFSITKSRKDAKLCLTPVLHHTQRSVGRH